MYTCENNMQILAVVTANIIMQNIHKHDQVHRWSKQIQSGGGGLEAVAITYMKICCCEIASDDFWRPKLGNGSDISDTDFLEWIYESLVAKV